MPQNIPGANQGPNGPLGKYTPVARRMRRRGYSEDEIAQIIDYMRQKEEATGIDPLDPISRQYGTGPTNAGGQTPPTPGIKPDTGPQQPPQMTRTGNPVADQVAPAYGQGDFRFNAGSQQRGTGRGGGGGTSSNFPLSFDVTRDPDATRRSSQGGVSVTGQQMYPPGPRGQMRRNAPGRPQPEASGAPQGNTAAFMQRLMPNMQASKPMPGTTPSGQAAPQNPAGPGRTDNQSADATTSTDTSDAIKQARNQRASGVTPQATAGPGGGPGTGAQATGLPQATPGAQQAAQAQQAGDDGGGSPFMNFMQRIGGAVTNDQGQLFGLGQDTYNDLLRFGLATMAADAQPNSTGLSALGKGGLAVMQGNRQQANRQAERQLARAQAGMGDSEIAQLKRQALQREAQPRIQQVVQQNDGQYVAIRSDGTTQPLGISGRAERDYTAVDALDTARQLATQQRYPKDPETGEPMRFGEPQETFDQKTFNYAIRQLGYPQFARQQDQNQQAERLPTTSDGALATDQLQQGQVYERNGRRAVFAGMQNGTPQWVPLPGGQ